MDAPFYFIELGRRRILFCDLSQADEFADAGPDVTFRSVVPVLRFETGGTRVTVIDDSVFGCAAMPPEARPVII